MQQTAGQNTVAASKGDLDETPVSVASNLSACIGLLALTAGVVHVVLTPTLSPVAAGLILIAAWAGAVALFELTFLKVHRKPSTGLDWNVLQPAAPGRVALKLLGLTVALSCVTGFHLFFRFYPAESLVSPLIALLWLAPVAVPLVMLYFWMIDRRMLQPRDAYWELGALIALRGRTPDWRRLKDFALGWTIKGIFLPIMFSYLVSNMPGFAERSAWLQQGPVAAVAWLSQVMVVMELTIVVVGYTLTARLFDAHIRSANPFLFAWVVTLVCYEPLNRIVTSGIT